MASQALEVVPTAISTQTLQAAEAYLAQQKWSEAFFNYLIVLRLTPSMKCQVRDDFTSALKHWGEECAHEGRFGDLMTCYQQAYEIFPENAIINSNLGAQLVRLGYIDEAASYFRKALRINPNFIQAQENLENVLSYLVERWHFRMLNDRYRNVEYRHNISTAIKAGKRTVLDIGTGTGLLAMFASAAGATEVYACEMSRTMVETAYDVLCANFMISDVNLIHKKSTNLVIGEEIPEKVDLIVTETFDCAVLGEGLLTTMQHALKHLMKPDARVIPTAATVYVTAIESAEIRRQHRSVFKGLRNLDLSDISILSKVGAPCDQAYFDHHYGDSDTMEPYTTERLLDLPGGYKELSAAVKVEAITLGSIEDIERWCNGVTKKFQLAVYEAGRLDALMMTFDLHLGEETSTLNSHPDSGSCWEQAIFPVHPHHVNPVALDNLTVRPGALLDVTLDCQDKVFSLQCERITRKSTNASNEKSFESSGGTPVDANSNSRAEWAPLFFSSPEILVLNNLDTNTTLCRGLEKFLALLRRKRIPNNIIFQSLGLTMLPLQSLKFGANAPNKVMVLNQTSHHIDLYNRVAKLNDIEMEKVLLKLDSESLESIVKDIHQNRDEGVQSGVTWGGLVVDLVESYGCLKQQVLEDIVMARMCGMVEGCQVFPNRVTAYGMFIESTDLMKDSTVIGDEVTCDFKVAEFMNVFHMTTHQDIHISTLKHRRLSEPFELFTFDLNSPLDTEEEMKKFLNRSRQLTVTCTNPGNLDATVYWFDMNLIENVNVSTLSPLYHWRQAAVICSPGFMVADGCPIDVKVSCHQSIVSIAIDLAKQSSNAHLLV